MADAKSDQQKQTLVEEGTEFKGSMSSSCPVVVRGRIEGDVSTPALTVSPTGAVHGRAKVGTLSSDGEVAGEFDADVVQLSGRVRDNTVIRAKSLEVKLAPANGKMQVVFGECALDVGDIPSKTDTVTSASEAPSLLSKSAKGRGRTSEPAPASSNGGAVAAEEERS
jgi:cytoskeletal protein CcmA (bactofilin family)